jgi:outer membrane protein OmpA-like peptidoglycan-associated protein
MRYCRAIGTILAVILLSSPSSAAPVPPRTQLEDFLSRATAVLVGATDAKQAGEDVRNLAGTLFDGRAAARSALGPEWDRYTGPERDEFARTFTAVLARAYFEVVRGWLPRDRPPAIRILGEEIAPGGRLAIVRTSVHARDGSDVQLDYTMIRADGAWLVHDVVIDGVSLLENYRVQFARVLRTSSYTQLMARLRAVAHPGGGEQVAASSKIESRPEFIAAYFDTSRADLDPAAQRALAAAATWLAANERARALVEGHADQQGASRLNQALAERRANAIRDNLVARGVDPDRIAVVAYGDRRPICQEPLEKCQALNRRAVVRLTP